MSQPGGEARARFSEIAALPDADIDLARAALWIAAEARPDIGASGIDAHLDTLAAIAERAQQQIEAAASSEDAAQFLLRRLCDAEDFRGNAENYYNPANSFLSEVLETRRGIPITLCIVFVDIARRLGLDAHGVGFPGHFLAKICEGTGERETLVDVFDASVITHRDCEARLQAMGGGQLRFDPRMLAATPSKQVLARVLGNLKQIYLHSRELEEALSCLDRILLLLPDSPGELRERGLLLTHLECFSAAASDLERFLELAPEDPSAPELRQLLARARRRSSSLN